MRLRSICSSSALGTAALFSLLAASCGDDGSDSATAGTDTNLDCSQQSHVSAGQLEDHALRGEAGLLLGKRSDDWYLHGVVDDFDFDAWHTPGAAPGVGRAHFTSTTTGEQLCVDGAVWTDESAILEPGGSPLLFSGFSSLGACADASGPTGKLRFCSAYGAGADVGPCQEGEARVDGEVGGKTIAESRAWFGDSNFVPGPADSIDTAFSGGGRLVFETQKDGGVSGSLRFELDGAVHVYCVKGVRDEAPDDDERQQLELDVIELGGCPGATLSGEIAACLY